MGGRHGNGISWEEEEEEEGFTHLHEVSSSDKLISQVAGGTMLHWADHTHSFH